MKPYQPHLFYKLYRALQDEGLADHDMVFDKEMTFVSDLGFFTLRFTTENVPQVVHFLVWPEKRVWHNSVRFYREMRRVLIDLGFVMAIMMEPKDKPQMGTFIKIVCAGTKNIKPYAERDGNLFYLVKFGRRYENIQ